ncbi:MAG: hypothetical protein E5W74_34355, partial [Mesorhizobium sp.]
MRARCSRKARSISFRRTSASSKSIWGAEHGLAGSVLPFRFRFPEALEKGLSMLEVSNATLHYGAAQALRGVSLK